MAGALLAGRAIVATLADETSAAVIVATGGLTYGVVALVLGSLLRDPVVSELILGRLRRMATRRSRE